MMTKIIILVFIFILGIFYCYWFLEPKPEGVIQYDDGTVEYSSKVIMPNGESKTVRLRTKVPLSGSNYKQFETNCPCGKYVTATYIEPHYWFECANCGKVFTNTDCEDVNEFYEYYN